MLTERRDSAIGPAALKKKLKSIKVPEKYEKVLEGIVSDTHETIDLTGAELGDNAMLQVCELFKYNCKARTIKLIRNKLTDEVIPKLIPSLCNAVTLNLSQNALTETAVGMLADNRALLPCLRSVILSHNKIIERKHKVAIDRLRKMDLIVSV